MTNKLKSKIENLEKVINDTKKNKYGDNNDKNETQTNINGFKYIGIITADILSGLFVGMIIGYYLDNFFQTKPLYFIVFMILGIAGGLANILKKLK